MATLFGGGTPPQPRPPKPPEVAPPPAPPPNPALPAGQITSFRPSGVGGQDYAGTGTGYGSTILTSPLGVKTKTAAGKALTGL